MEAPPQLQLDASHFSSQQLACSVELGLPSQSDSHKHAAKFEGRSVSTSKAVRSGFTSELLVSVILSLEGSAGDLQAPERHAPGQI
jgi:hypothetical protein